MMVPEPREWVEAVLWHGLAARPVPDADLDSALPEIVDQRLAALTLDYCAAHSVVLTPTQRATLLRQEFAWASHGAQALEAGNHAAHLLDEAGIPCVIFKGPAIKRLYQSPRYRLYSDIDILVAPATYRMARELFLARGWREDPLTVVPYDLMNVVCREAQNLKRRPGESVDLHHHLPPWLWTTQLTFDDIYTDSEIVDGQRSMNAEWNLLVASLHLVSDRSKPGQTVIIWRDLAELARSVDPSRAVELATRSGLGPWLRSVLSLLPGDLRPESLIALLPNGSPPHRRRLQLLTDQRLVGRRIPIVQLFRLPVPRAFLYALGMSLPPPSFIRSRYHKLAAGYREWWIGPAHH